MEAKQLQTLKQNNALLCQFIVKLSAFYEGFSDWPSIWHTKFQPSGGQY